MREWEIGGRNMTKDKVGWEKGRVGDGKWGK